MSLPKNIFLITLLAGLLPVFAYAGTGLYGFDSINPYTNSEKILHMDYLPDSVRNYRADMRDNLLMLVDYARKHNPDFQVLSHEGQELLYKSRWEYELEGYNRVRTLKENANDPVFLFNKDLGNPEPESNTPEYRWLHMVNAVVLNNYYCGHGKEEADRAGCPAGIRSWQRIRCQLCDVLRTDADTGKDHNVQTERA